MPNEKIAIIVATKDRPDDIIRLMESVSWQSVKPAQTIIVDGGKKPLDLTAFKSFPLAIDYVRKIPPSLTAQRNEGIRALRADISIAAFLDDDIVLEADAIEEMARFWGNAPQDVGGSSFNLVNELHGKPSFMERIFSVNSPEPNTMLRSGFQGRVVFVEKDIPAQWLVGCAMVYRKKIFDEFLFDEWFSGYARYEDVDFSYRVGKKYKMYVVSAARAEHFEKPEENTFSLALGKMEVINRLYFVKKYKEFSVGLCWWALFGIFLNNIIKGTFRANRRYLDRARGNAAGFIQVLLYGSGMPKK